jgi:hypothetical protein
LTNADIPHWTTLRKEILARAEIVKERVKEELKVCPFKKIPNMSPNNCHKNIQGTVSFTFDTWTSKTGDPFLSITGHYIAVLPDRPDAWELKTQQLAFAPFEGHHSGSNMSNVIIRTLDRYSIREKVIHWT